jgi:hypothetical protein
VASRPVASESGDSVVPAAADSGPVAWAVEPEAAVESAAAA